MQPQNLLGYVGVLLPHIRCEVILEPGSDVLDNFVGELHHMRIGIVDGAVFNVGHGTSLPTTTSDLSAPCVVRLRDKYCAKRTFSAWCG